MEKYKEKIMPRNYYMGGDVDKKKWKKVKKVKK